MSNTQGNPSDFEYPDLEDGGLFREAVETALETIEDIKIANALAVSRSTVHRWAKGTACPHPAMRKPVYKALHQLQKEKQP